MASFNNSQVLQAGTRLEEFVIEGVIGAGGFGVTYLAKDRQLGRKVVIKENFPRQICFRDPRTLTIYPNHNRGADLELFRWALENFGKEAKMLAHLDHPRIVKVHRSFEAFGTGYFVMPFVEGVSLEGMIAKRLGRGQYFTEEEAKGFLCRVLDALEYLHERGIFHRDIKPSNILMTKEGRPILIDFGAARHSLGERSSKVIESEGYTPFEQMQTSGKMGPWTDLYALGATTMTMIFGVPPPRSVDRLGPDRHQRLNERKELRGRYSGDFLRGIDQALEMVEGNRWQSANDWVRWLRGKRVEREGVRKQGMPVPPPGLMESQSGGLGAMLFWAFILVAVILVVVLGAK